MQRAMAKVLAENPDIKPVTLSSSSVPSSIITRAMMPKGSMATTNPFTGNITYNPDAMVGQSPFDMEQTLQHELTHSRQAQTTPWWKTAAGLFTPDEKVPQGAGPSMQDPYYWRPHEMQAFESERTRAERMHRNITDPVTGSMDIQLPRTRRKVNTAPSSDKLMQLVGGK